METAFLKLPFSTKMAIISFILGTLLFLSYFIVNDNMILIIIGIYYIIIVTIINILMLLKLFYDWLENPFQKNSISKQILILLANIPIAFTYYSILVYSVTSNSPF